MRAVTDEQLIDWVARGDASCLGTLFERHNKAVYQYCRQMTRHSAQAEDLTQEVFLRILKKASGASILPMVLANSEFSVR